MEKIGQGIQWKVYFKCSTISICHSRCMKPSTDLFSELVFKIEFICFHFKTFSRKTKTYDNTNKTKKHRIHKIETYYDYEITKVKENLWYIKSFTCKFFLDKIDAKKQDLHTRTRAK